MRMIQRGDLLCGDFEGWDEDHGLDALVDREGTGPMCQGTCSKTVRRHKLDS